MKRVVFGVLGVVFVVVVAFPLLWTVMSSLKDSMGILNSPWALPSPPHPENYKTAWEGENLGKAFFVSLGVAMATLAVLLPVGSMAAYVLAKFRFRGAGFVLMLFLGGMMFPNLLAAVPLRGMASEFGFYNSLPGLVLVYVAYSLSFTVFVMHGFFLNLPDELGEAASMDGAGPGGVFWRVMLPLAKPGLIVAGIFNAIGFWNEYNLAKLLLAKENYTLPLALANLVGKQVYDADFGSIFAAMVLVMVPVLGVYWLFKERIQEAMLSGAIK